MVKSIGIQKKIQLKNGGIVQEYFFQRTFVYVIY